MTVDRREAVVDDFRRRVLAGGTELVEEAVGMILTGGRAARRRAQLILTQVDDLPPLHLDRLRESPRPDVWAYALLRGPREQWREPERLKAAPPPPDLTYDPLRDVAAAIRERLVLSADELRHAEESGSLDIYREEVLPALDEIEKHVGDRARVFVDLDRDGRPELLVSSDGGWSTRAMPFTFIFVALMRQHPGDGRWELVCFERLDMERFNPSIEVMDLDHDGYPEAVVESCAVGANHTTAYVRVFSRHHMSAPLTIVSSGPSPSLLFLQRRADDPILMATSEFIAPEQFMGSTMGERVGPGLRWHLHRWNGRRFVRFEEALTPYL